MYQFIKDMGMGFVFNDMNKEAKGEYMKKLHGQLIIYNAKIPDTADIFTLYTGFTKDVFYSKIKLPEKSAWGLTEAFNKWVDQPHIRDMIGYVRTTRLPTQSREKTIQDMTDDEIKNTLENLKKIDKEMILGMSGGDGYFARLKAEANKRKLL